MRSFSIVWEYYSKKNQNGVIYATCRYCSSKFRNNATRMANHLTKCVRCPVNIKKIFIQQTPTEVPVKNKKSEGSLLEESRSQSHPQNQNLASTDLEASSSSSSHGLLQFFDNMNSDEKVVLDKMFAEAVYSSGSPFSIVENDKFKKFLKRIRPCYSLPSRYQLSHTMLDAKYNQIKSLVDKKIRVSNNMAILTDGWTNIHGIPLVNVIVTVPEPLFLKTIDTGTSSHTGKFICDTISAVIEEIGPEKVQAIVTDNASNMKLAWSLLRSRYPKLITYGCAAHGLNLLAKDVITEVATFSTLIADVKNIIKFYREKHVPRQMLRKCQLELCGHEIALLLPSKTRWNSTFMMLSSLVKTKEHLQAATASAEIMKVIAPELRQHIFDEEGFWQVINILWNLLKPINDGILLTEGDTPKMPSVFSAIKNIEESFNKYSTELAAADREILLSKCANRKDFILHPVHFATYFLHPKFQGQLLSEDEKLQTIDFIVRLATSNGFDELLIHNEIARYRARRESWSNPLLWKAAKGCTDPLTWWQGYFSETILGRIASMLLNLPATSASCERNWKTDANIQTKKRNRLTLKKTEKLVFIRYNTDLMENMQSGVDENFEETVDEAEDVDIENAQDNEDHDEYVDESSTDSSESSDNENERGGTDDSNYNIVEVVEPPEDNQDHTTSLESDVDQMVYVPSLRLFVKKR